MCVSVCINWLSLYMCENAPEKSSSKCGVSLSHAAASGCTRYVYNDQ